MQYATATPAIDLEHLLDVIGKDAFIEKFHLPPDEWGLTPEQIERLRVGRHGILYWHEHTTEAFGMTVTFTAARCECGEDILGDLYSEVYAAHDAHSGRRTSRIHTADLLNTH